MTEATQLSGIDPAFPCITTSGNADELLVIDEDNEVWLYHLRGTIPEKIQYGDYSQPETYRDPWLDYEEAPPLELDHPYRIEINETGQVGVMFGVVITGTKPCGTTTTTTPDAPVPNLELTYPAGESPKVFIKGWVFGARCTYINESGQQVDISDQVSWGGTGTFNPNKGSRSYPAFNSEGQNTIELSVTVNGKEYKKDYQVETVNTMTYSSLGDRALNPSDAHGCPGCFHTVVGPLLNGSLTVSIDGKPAARVGDFGIHSTCCWYNLYTIISGDKNVLIDGLPAAKKDDITKHCGGMGRLIEGAPGEAIITIESEYHACKTHNQISSHKEKQHTCSIPHKTNVQAEEGGTISGKATDTAGAGILGVGVTAYGETNLDVWGTITDENGEYQITGLPDDSFRIHFWGGNWAYNDGYLSSWYNGKSSMDTADPVTITGSGSITGIDATLPAGGSISGTVKDASGAGIEKATVRAIGESGGMSFGYTDESGKYQIAGLESNNYRIYCDAKLQGYIGEWYNDKSSQDTADIVTVTAPNRVSGIDFSLPASGGISGTVKDTSGNGIEEVYVKAFGESTEKAGMGATDENGAYEILGISDDSYRIQFQGESQGYINQWYNDKSSWDTAELVTVTAPNKTTGIDAKLLPVDGAALPCLTKEIYGDHVEEGELLRDFRDNVFSKTRVGQKIIRLYYRSSPAIVKAMEENETFKVQVRKIIDGFLPVIRELVE